MPRIRNPLDLSLEVLELLEAVGAAVAKGPVPGQLTLVAVRVRENGEQGVEVGLVGHVGYGERVQQPAAANGQLQIEVSAAHPAVMHSDRLQMSLAYLKF